MKNLTAYDVFVNNLMASDIGDKKLRLCVWALGLVGEAGESSELIKKHAGHKHDLNPDEVVKELGDVLFYVSALAQELGYGLDDVMAKNIEKLSARYPDGFDPEVSKARYQIDA